MLIKDDILLRALNTKSDFNDIYRWRNDLNLRKNIMLHPFPVSPQLEEKWLDRITTDLSNRQLYFGIQKFKAPNLIGYTLLNDIDWVNRRCYFGILIGEQSARGKGIGTTVTHMMIDYAFNQLNLYKILLQVLSSNVAAQSLYSKLGFQTEGRLHKHFYWQGEWFDAIIMSKFRSS